MGSALSLPTTQGVPAGLPQPPLPAGSVGPVSLAGKCWSPPCFQGRALLSRQKVPEGLSGASLCL